MTFSEFWSYYGSGIYQQFIEHVIIVVIATAIGAIVGVGCSIACSRSTQLSEAVLKVCSLLLTIPALAMYVLLLGIFGLGWKPVLVALTLYSLLPIVQNTLVGLRTVDKSTLEAASGIGMGAVTRLVRVEIPMAWPIILSGIRTGSLLLVSIAAIGALIRGPGLGGAIYDGLNRIGTPVALYLTLTGIAGVMLVGLLINGLFSILHRSTIPRGIRA